MGRSVWVTGLGCVCAAGRDAASSMRGVAAGLRPQAVPDFFSSVEPVNPVCAVSLGDGRGDWRRGSTRDSSFLMRMAASEAVADAAPDTAEGAGSLDLFAGARVGLCVGTTSGCALHFLDDYAALRTEEKEGRDSGCAFRATADFFQHSMAFDLAASLAGMGMESTSGPVITVTNACTSGTDAIGLAASWIEAGLCDVALAGGADALSIVPYIGFDRLMIYSPEPCRPFDRLRRGLNLGEGAAALVLESEAHAAGRGVKPRAVIAGYGAAADAYHMTAPHPEGRGLRGAIGRAMRAAGISASELGFINAHGTCTPENDRSEGAVYASMLVDTPVWASKGVTGHCLGAAGAVEAALSIMALERGVVPSSAGCAEPEDDMARLITLEPVQVLKPYAMSVSLGFGGSNSALVFAAGDAERRPG